MRFDLVDLRLFLAVAELGSITRAAERANMALPSASARVRGMEEDLGTPLLERGSRGVTLTAAGRTLARHAQSIQMQMEAMVGDLSAYSKGLRGSVKLLSNTSAASEFLAPMLSTFLVAHENIDVEMEERASDVIAEAVLQGSADLGIVAPYARVEGLEYRPFRLDRLVLISATRKQICRTGAVSFSEVLNEPMVGLTQGSPLQDHIIRNAARLGARLKFRIRVPRLDEVCELVSRNVGVAIVPEHAVLRSAQRAGLNSVALSDEWATRELMICARRFEELPSHARLLAEALAQNDRPQT